MEALISSVARDFAGKDLPPDFAQEFATALVREYATVEVPRTRPGTLGMLVGRYALRKDDLKLFDAIAEGLKAAAGVTFFATDGPALGAKVAIGVSLARLLRTLVIRGAWLAPDALHVLTILSCNVSGAEQ